MNRNGNQLQFTTIGENIHTTRVLLRKGKRIVRNPDGVESVLYRDSEGETRYLPIPEAVKRTQDYQEGRVKHVKIAVLAAQAGGPGSEEGLRYLRYLVDRQLSAEVDFLDLNVDEVSLKLNEQKEAMQWLVGTVQAMSPVPVSVDSSNIEIIQAGLEACHDKSGRNLLNSASLERLEALDLAREHDTKVIVTAAGEKGMPQNEVERLENASRMVEAALARGISLDSIYVDVLVFPMLFIRSACSASFTTSLARISPFRQRSAAAVNTPSGAPPIPMTAWTPVPRRATLMPAERSPSVMSRIRAPADRMS